MEWQEDIIEEKTEELEAQKPTKIVKKPEEDTPEKEPVKDIQEEGSTYGDEDDITEFGEDTYEDGVKYGI